MCGEAEKPSWPVSHPPPHGEKEAREMGEGWRRGARFAYPSGPQAEDLRLILSVQVHAGGRKGALIVRLAVGFSPRRAHTTRMLLSAFTPPARGVATHRGG